MINLFLGDHLLVLCDKKKSQTLSRRQGRKEVAGAAGPKYMGAPREVLGVPTSDPRIQSPFPAASITLCTPRHMPHTPDPRLQVSEGPQRAVSPQPTAIPGFQHWTPWGLLRSHASVCRETQSFLCGQRWGFLPLSPPAQGQELSLLRAVEGALC